MAALAEPWTPRSASAAVSAAKIFLPLLGELLALQNPLELIERLLDILTREADVLEACDVREFLKAVLHKQHGPSEPESTLKQASFVDDILTSTSRAVSRFILGS